MLGRDGRLSGRRGLPAARARPTIGGSMNHPDDEKTERPRLLIVAPTALDNAGRLIRQKKLYLPALTLPHLAALTPPEWEVRLLYETVEEIPFDEHWDLVALTGMGSGVPRAWKIADEFREQDVPVVLGGVGASLGPPEWSLEHVDSLVIGEAEELWPRLLDDRANGHIRQVYRADRPPSLDDLPVPRYDLLPARFLGPWRPVQATRGCPFTCSFCSVTAFHHHEHRARPIEQVVRDVRAARATGTRHIAFVDDNIAADVDYFASLCEALVPEKIQWMSQAGLHVADHPDLLHAAWASGCRFLSIGIESVDPRNLATIGKVWNRPDEYAEAIRTIRGCGIDVGTEMMIGLDHDDPDVFERIYRFVIDNAISVPRIYLVTPVPGTPLFAEMEAAGRMMTHDIMRFTGGQVVCRPKGIEADDLERGYWQLYERLFSWPNLFRRAVLNRAGLGPFMRGVVLGANLHYREHIHRRITPGIV